MTPPCDAIEGQTRSILIPTVDENFGPLADLGEGNFGRDIKALWPSVNVGLPPVGKGRRLQQRGGRRGRGGGVGRRCAAAAWSQRRGRGATATRVATAKLVPHDHSHHDSLGLHAAVGYSTHAQLCDRMKMKYSST